MIGLAGAILVASLLGSMHCVGMCGPMALWAGGVGQAGVNRGGAWARLTAYHGGRAVTFLAAGLAAGWFGGLVTAGGDWLGWQQSAARLAGAAMIGMGVWRLLNWLRPSVWQDHQTSDPAAAGQVAASPASRPKFASQSGFAPYPGPAWNRRWSLAVSAQLARLRPTITRLPGLSRAFAIGLVTTWLPCGWLYLFVLVAAATASPLTAVLVMTAFWLGTLPALTALVGGAIGTVGVAPRLRSAMPLLIAVVLLVSGSYTISGRAAADLRPLGEAARQWGTSNDGSDARHWLDGLGAQPLPCCEPAGEPLVTSPAQPTSPTRVDTSTVPRGSGL